MNMLLDRIPWRDTLQNIPKTEPAKVHRMPLPKIDWNVSIDNLDEMLKRIDDLERSLCDITEKETKKLEEFAFMREQVRNERAKILTAYTRERERLLTPLITRHDGDPYWHKKDGEIEDRPMWDAPNPIDVEATSIPNAATRE